MILTQSFSLYLPDILFGAFTIAMLGSVNITGTVLYLAQTDERNLQAINGKQSVHREGHSKPLAVSNWFIDFL